MLRIMLEWEQGSLPVRRCARGLVPLAVLALTTEARWAEAEPMPQVIAEVPGYRPGLTEPTAKEAIKPDGKNGGNTVLFNRLLPAGEAFDLRVLAPSTGAVAGTVEVWPDENHSCKAPNTQSRQFYRLRLTADGKDDDRVLRSQIPPLQVDQPYCFKLSLRRSATEVEIKAIAGSSVGELLAPLLSADGAACYQINAPDETKFTAALGRATKAADLQGNVELAASLALREFVTSSAASCDALVKAVDLLQRYTAANEEQEQRLKTSTTALAKVHPPGPQRSPLLLLAEKPVLVHSLIAPAATDADLKSALQQLQQREALMEVGPQKTGVRIWSAALKKLIADLGKAKDTKDRDKLLKDAAKRIADPKAPDPLPLPFLELVWGAKIVTAPEYQRNPRIAPSVVIAELEAFPTRAEHIKPLRDAVIELAAALADKQQADLAFKAALAEHAKQAEATRAGLRAAVESNTVRDALAIALNNDTTDVPGRGTTPPAANWASLDAGVALAFPSGSDAQNFWALPYVGLNLYSVPVDRTIRLDALAGRSFRQRVSITLGMTLTEPGLPDRSIHSVLFDNYPIAAFGYRVTHFARFTAGGVFYWLEAANPASSKVEFHAAPFVGASLDIDLIHMLTQAKL
jgi:hypothetical protein